MEGEGDFNNILLFSGNFCGGDKAVMEEDKVVIGKIPPVPPHRENPAECSCLKKNKHSKWDKSLLFL